MPYKTYAQRMEYVRMWAESGLTQGVFCAREGISSRTFSRWIKLAKENGFAGGSLKPSTARRELISWGNQSADIITDEKPFGSMVLVNRSKTEFAVTPVLNERTSITIEYMGAKISIDEGSIESVFRALKAVSGCNL